MSTASRCRQAGLRDATGQVFACLFLDRGFRLIAFEELSRGAFDPRTAELRRVARRAVHHDARALIGVRSCAGESSNATSSPTWGRA